MKSVYIICDLFPPAFAPRVAYLTKYIAQWGWQARVFAEQIDEHQLFSDFTPSCPVHLIDLLPKNRLKRPLRQLGELFFESKERRMLSAIKAIIKAENLAKPDAILCLTYRKFPLRSASHLAKEWDIPFVADCRDIIEQYSKGDFLPKPLTLCGVRLSCLESLFARIYLNQRNKYLAEATAVTTVSQWHKQVLERFNSQTSIIYNGYDDELFHPVHQKMEQFRIVYTGRLLSLSMRNPKLLFEALRSDRLKDLDLSLDFYTDDYSKSLLLSEDWAKAEPRLNIKAMRSSKEVPALLNQASLILLLANEEEGTGSPKGMVTTKLFEAMAVAKPCLLLPITSGEAVSLVQQANCGIASNSVEEIINYIIAQYKVWQEQGFCAVKLNEDFVQTFSRKKQAKAFAQLLDEIQ